MADRRPVIGYTIELEDPLLLEVEPALRMPLERFGALPLVLPRTTPLDRLDQLLDMIDGVQLCGGADVHPRHYGEDVHELTRPASEQQDDFEITLARRALDRGMPVIGICRGIQVLAVAGGGRLTQDVETMHDGAPRPPPALAGAGAAASRASTGTGSRQSRDRRPSAG